MAVSLSGKRLLYEAQWLEGRVATIQMAFDLIHFVTSK